MHARTCRWAECYSGIITMELCRTHPWHASDINGHYEPVHQLLIFMPAQRHRTIPGNLASSVASRRGVAEFRETVMHFRHQRATVRGGGPVRSVASSPVARRTSRAVGGRSPAGRVQIALSVVHARKRRTAPSNEDEFGRDIMTSRLQRRARRAHLSAVRHPTNVLFNDCFRHGGSRRRKGAGRCCTRFTV